MYSTQDREARIRELIARLKAGEGRVTPQRLAVLRALVYNENHPSAEDIYRKLKPAFPTMSFATVYKIIDKLKTMGEVLELQFRDGSNRYDGMKATPHAHLGCASCGKIFDLDVDPPLEAAAKAARKLGFRLVGMRFDLYGTCGECRRQRV